MKWHADITSVDNGFVVDYCDGEGKRKVVYQEKDNAESIELHIENDKEHVVNMLWDLIEFFGEAGGKHDKKRIKITYEKQ